MRGPYTAQVRFGETAPHTMVEPIKRWAIRWVRRVTKERGVHGEIRATGEVRDADGELVRQVEAYLTQRGTPKVRDLEL